MPREMDKMCTKTQDAVGCSNFCNETPKLASHKKTETDVKDVIVG